MLTRTLATLLVLASAAVAQVGLSANSLGNNSQSAWISHIGIPQDDPAVDPTDQGFLMSKTDPGNTTGVRAYGVFTGVFHQSADGVYGWEYRNTTHCGVSPQMVVVTTDGITHRANCSSGTIVPDTNRVGWNFDTFSSTAQFVPPIPSGSLIQTVQVTFFDGTDPSNVDPFGDDSGLVVLDRLFGPFGAVGKQ